MQCGLGGVILTAEAQVKKIKGRAKIRSNIRIQQMQNWQNKDAMNRKSYFRRRPSDLISPVPFTFAQRLCG